MAQRGCHWHVLASQKPWTSSLEVKGILATTTSPALHTGHPVGDGGLPASKQHSCSCAGPCRFWTCWEKGSGTIPYFSLKTFPSAAGRARTSAYTSINPARFRIKSNTEEVKNCKPAGGRESVSWSESIVMLSTQVWSGEPFPTSSNRGLSRGNGSGVTQTEPCNTSTRQSSAFPLLHRPHRHSSV